jgi:hypothetical protein
VSQNARFTAWLSEEELELVRELAGEQASSANYVVRMAVRYFFGLSVAPWARTGARAPAPMADADRELVLGGERAVS